MGNSELHPSMSNDFFIYFSDGEFDGGKIINCGTIGCNKKDAKL